jgi:hypothetical protein
MRLLSAATAALLLTAVSAASASSAIDVQFSGSDSHAQTGAAVIGQAGDAWNNFTTGSQANRFLVDTSGAQSGVTLSFSSSQSYESDASYTQFTGTPYANLMQGYLVGRGTSDIDLTFGGLTAGQEYGFYVYTQGDDNSKNRSIGISANGGAQTSSTQSDIGTFVEGDNYLYIVATANSLGVVDLVGQNLNDEGNINGVQLLAVPEPSSVALLLAGLVFLGGAAVRKSRAR